MSLKGQSRRFCPICVGSGLPLRADMQATGGFVAKGHMRKYRSRNGIVRPVNGSTKHARKSVAVEVRRSFLARGG